MTLTCARVLILTFLLIISCGVGLDLSTKQIPHQCQKNVSFYMITHNTSIDTMSRYTNIKKPPVIPETPKTPNQTETTGDR